MAAWWQSLTTLEHVLLYIAVPATLILILQTVLLLVGGAFDGDGEVDGDLDADFDGGADVDGDGDLDGADLDTDLDTDGDGPDGEAEVREDGAAAGLHLFTVRGVVAFLTLFGWGSLCFSQLGFPPFLAVFLGIPVGIAGMVGIALILREALKLQYDGTLDLRNAVGLSGTVYLTVPPGRAASGKVNVTVQEQLQEFEAVTDSDTPLPTGSPVRVAGLAGEDTLLVEPVEVEEVD